MGTKLYSKEKNGTIYSIRILPLGGYCKMKDEDSEGSDPDSFSNATMPKKLAIVFAGAFMNFVLALIIFIGIVLFNGTVTTTIKEVSSGYPAIQAGIRAGDKIHSINGNRVRSFDDVTFNLMNINSESKAGINIVVKRENKKLEFNLLPKFDEKTNKALIGVLPTVKNGTFAKNIDDVEKSGFFESIYYGFWNMIFTIKVTIIGVVELFTGKVNFSQVMGPIGLTPVINDTYEEAIKTGIGATILTMLNIMALLSANIGVMNLLPIPALDGGRILFFLIEILRGKPISPEKEGMVHFVGFVILMGFGILIAFKDIINIF